MSPEQHPSWPELTDRQREAVNEVWNETVVAALEEADEARRESDAARLEAQDARALARLTQEHADRRAERERARRQELHRRIAALETRLLEQQGMAA